MPRRINCSNCQALLRLPEDIEERWVTCPRCLTSVLNPERTGTPALTSHAGVMAEEPAQAPRSCPGCGAGMEAAWRHCPFCDASLRRVRRSPRRRSADAEARLDLGLIGYGLIALGLLALFGVIALPIVGGVMFHPEVVVAMGGGILLVVLAGIGLGLASHKPGIRTSISVVGAITVMLIILGLLPLALCMGMFQGCDQARPRVPMR